MKFLVTGSAGLIGSQVVKDLVEQNHEVYSGYHKIQPEHGISINIDLTNQDDIKDAINRFKPDNIIHLAAMTEVEQCEKEPDLAMKINANATEIIAKQAAKQNIFLTYVSTDYVFDGIKGSFTEQDEPNPINYYGKSKLEGEKIIQNQNSKWCIARTSTPFGNFSSKKTFPNWVIQELKKNHQLNILEDQFTSPTYIPNLSNMLIEISEKEINQITHTADASRISRYDLAIQISKKFDLDESLINPITMENIDWHASRPKDSSLDVSKANKILENKPQKIEDSLKFLLNKK